MTGHCRNISVVARIERSEMRGGTPDIASLYPGYIAR
jgi:hypothetical protein